MSVHAIYLNKPSERVWEAVRKEWNKRHFVLDDRLAFVASDKEEFVTTKQIAKRVGILQQKDTPGIVMKIGPNHGYNDTELWEWMEQFEG